MEAAPTTSIISGVLSARLRISSADPADSEAILRDTLDGILLDCLAFFAIGSSSFDKLPMFVIEGRVRFAVEVGSTVRSSDSVFFVFFESVVDVGRPFDPKICRIHR